MQSTIMKKYYEGMEIKSALSVGKLDRKEKSPRIAGRLI